MSVFDRNTFLAYSGQGEKNKRQSTCERFRPISGVLSVGQEGPNPHDVTTEGFLLNRPYA